ncbi:hypothetical protein [Kitasatospora phosalacinea]|uniref:Uncharacterized protein n=1 Tax=Kitasatospora phosalacinea TaxID=2065 RepID=A0A9W6PQB5_9ACTN|nr:hypothetical protein [Kitasatospora phosalacinea]GLW59312.1 hypothetical protein Kpho01_73220 [Kitasatospora phosalacinea]
MALSGAEWATIDGHPGWSDEDTDHRHRDEQIAKRMYNVLAPAVANVKNVRSATDPAPEVVVDDTLASSAP